MYTFPSLYPRRSFNKKDTFSWPFKSVLRLLKSSQNPLLLNLEDVDLARVFQRLPPVAEPNSDHLSVIVQLSCDLRNLLARWQRVLLKVRVEDLNGLRREAGAPLALFGRFATHKLHQVLLALLVPVFRFRQPLFQHRLQLLRAFGGYVQLFKPALQKKPHIRLAFICKAESAHDFSQQWLQLSLLFKIPFRTW